MKGGKSPQNRNKYANEVANVTQSDAFIMASRNGARRSWEEQGGGFTAAAGGVLSQIEGSLYPGGTHTISYVQSGNFTHKYRHTSTLKQTHTHCQTTDKLS